MRTLKRWGLVLGTLAATIGVATATALVVFAYGDALGNRALVVGWRLKNAAAEVAWDGSIAPISAAAVEVAARRICDEALTEQLRRAEAEVKAADTYLKPIAIKTNATRKR